MHQALRVLGRPKDASAGAAIFIEYQELTSGSLSFKKPGNIEVKPASASAYLYYCLGQIGELVRWEEWSKKGRFQITLISCQQAKTVGFDHQKILELLERCKGPRTEIPAGLKFQIKSWSGYYQPLTSNRILAVEAQQPEFWQELFGLPEMAWLKEKIKRTGR